MKTYQTISRLAACISIALWSLQAKAQQNVPFNKTVSVYTKSPSLSCPHLGLNLKDNIAKRPQKISDVVIDNFTHQKITFSIRDSAFFNRDSILLLFTRSGFPGIELTKLEMQGQEPTILTK